MRTLPRRSSGRREGADEDLRWIRTRLIALSVRLGQIEQEPHRFARKQQLDALRLATDDLILAAARALGAGAATTRGPAQPQQREQLTAMLRQHGIHEIPRFPARLDR